MMAKSNEGRQANILYLLGFTSLQVAGHGLGNGNEGVSPFDIIAFRNLKACNHSWVTILPSPSKRPYISQGLHDPRQEISSLLQQVEQSIDDIIISPTVLFESREQQEAFRRCDLKEALIVYTTKWGLEI